ncbi:hypothetical protein BABINDRAFT_7100 [Babjeviella inositovora NRRL Y-12698]|uniref:TAFII28-like protein domain-containing protein n=1 Tax=Babjeviella inositovora NRRL Y-12698 TaxID=984486 RepID=A0A1E3QUD4_9ASCO|nr:uncharacterized protein BABINDRAFT_7100 [Babjeviella inositovora NRRL Y-12698]ODQ81289.1 hypothetical protein BABINDRAFT_7100 [Babjeviella inositovora NRRL Y-12698]
MDPKAILLDDSAKDGVRVEGSSPLKRKHDSSSTDSSSGSDSSGTGSSGSESSSDESSSEEEDEEQIADDQVLWQALFLDIHGEEQDEEQYSDNDSDLIEDLDEKEQLKLLLDNFDEKQMRRYQVFRNGPIKLGIKKVANNTLPHQISNPIATALVGISKIFVMEIIEKAKLVQERHHKARLLMEYQERKAARQCRKEKETGTVKQPELKLASIEDQPLLPEHLREAWRLYQLEHRGNPTNFTRRGAFDGHMFR